MPSLVNLCIKLLVDNSTRLKDLSGLAEDVGISIIAEVIARQRLTYPLAHVFIRSFPGTELAAAVKSLDLYAAMSPPRYGSP